MCMCVRMCVCMCTCMRARAFACACSCVLSNVISQLFLLQYPVVRSLAVCGIEGRYILYWIGYNEKPVSRPAGMTTIIG